MSAPLTAPTPAVATPAVGALEALRDPEFVTVAGDFHGEAGWGRHVVKAAARAGSQVVVQVGDFGVWRGRGGDYFLDHLDFWAAKTGVPVLFVDGNHEDFDHLATFPVHPGTGLRVLRPWVLHAPRGTRWTWRGLTWLALGGATSLDRARRTNGFDWFAQEALTAGDVYRAVADGPVDVMVTHDSPEGADLGKLDPTQWSAAALYDANAHRKLLRSAVDQVRPTHLFHGHYHRRTNAELDLGAGLVCQVVGLDMNGTGGRAFVHLDLDILTAESAGARA